MHSRRAKTRKKHTTLVQQTACSASVDCMCCCYCCFCFYVTAVVVVVVDYYLCLLIVTNTLKYTHAREEVKEGRTVCVYSIRGAQGAKKTHRVPPTATTHSTHFCATWAQRSHSKTQNCEIVVSQTQQQQKGGVEKQKAAANKIPIGNVWLYDLQWRLFLKPNLGSSDDRVKTQDARAVKYNLKTTDINTHILH